MRTMGLRLNQYCYSFLQVSQVSARPRMYLRIAWLKRIYESQKLFKSGPKEFIGANFQMSVIYSLPTPFKYGIKLYQLIWIPSWHCGTMDNKSCKMANHCYLQRIFFRDKGEAIRTETRSCLGIEALPHTWEVEAQSSLRTGEGLGFMMRPCLKPARWVCLCLLFQK